MSPLGRRLVLAATAGLALGSPSPAAGAATPAGPEFALSGATVSVSPSPTVAANEYGVFASLWLGECVGGEFGLCLRTVGEDGEPDGPGARLELAGDLPAAAPPAVLTGGRVWIVYAAENDALESTEIRLRQYNLGGGLLATTVVAAGSFGADVERPALALQPGGGVVVVWMRLGPEQAGAAIEGRRISPDGLPFGTIFRVDPVNSGEFVGDPVVAADAGGDFLVAWESVGFDAEGDDVVARAFAHDGTPQGDPFNVHLQSAGIQDSPAVAATPDGSFLVAWESRATTGPGPGLFARAVGAAGPLGASETRLSTATPGTHELPSLAGTRDGFVAVWHAVEATTGRIYLRRYDAAGVPQGVEEAVATTLAVDSQAHVAADAAGNLLVAWNRRQPDFNRQIFARRYLEEPPGACTPSARTLCLLGGRFAVEVAWRDQRTGSMGLGTAVASSQSERTGFFWFFNAANLELVVKALDGRPVTGKFWLFYGALSDVNYEITVTDVTTGELRRYTNSPGNICGRGDTAAFPLSQPVTALAGLEAAALAAPRSASEPGGWRTLALPVPAPRGAGTCVPTATDLCLLGDRFRVSVAWHDERSGDSGVGTAVPESDKTGFFWFFNSTNLELVVKALDGNPVNGHFWVFYGALSDVHYTITVTDTVTQAVRTYHNAQGNICGRGDTEAF